MTYKEKYEEVIDSGNYNGKINKIEALAQINYNDNKIEGKSNAVWVALENYEDMTGFYFDPTTEQFEDILSSIH